MIEVKNPKGIRLTQGEDGIFLHFDAGEKKCGIEIGSMFRSGGDIKKLPIFEWAKQQLTIKDEKEEGREVIAKTQTTISCPYTLRCRGHLTIVYSSLRQQIEVECGECRKVSVIMNTKGALIG